MTVDDELLLRKYDFGGARIQLDETSVEPEATVTLRPIVGHIAEQQPPLLFVDHVASHD